MVGRHVDGSLPACDHRGRMRRVIGYELLGVVAVVLASTAVANARAEGAWKVTTVQAGSRASLVDLVALPRGPVAMLLEVRAGRRHRLILRTGSRSRVLMSARHSLGGELAADGRGRLSAAWTTIPDGSGIRQAYVWTGGTTRALTSGPGHVSWVRIAVAADGAGVVAVEKGGGVTMFRRSRTGPFGEPEVLAGAAGVDDVAAAPGARFAVAGSGVAGPGGAGKVAAVAPRISEPFPAAVRLTPAPGPANTSALLRPATVGFTRAGAVVVAFSALHQQVGPPSERPPPFVGGVVQAFVWPRGAAGPGDPVAISRGRFAYDPLFVSSGDRQWLAWLETSGRCCRADTLAAARLTREGIGAAVTRRVAVPGLLGIDRPSVAAAPHDGLRWYLPRATRNSSALQTLLLDRNGRFGPLQTVAAGRNVAFANFSVTPIPAHGQPVDLVGWNSPLSNRSTQTRVRLARP